LKTNANFVYLNGLYWENKAEEVEQHIAKDLLSLTEVKSRKVGKVGPVHQIIEGDNLGALHLLNKKGKTFDLIYIDPPYNTGNKGFKYTDTYFNTEDEARHSTWSSFMHKRLQKAKQLLSDNGVIFLAIDDAEQARLKLICDGIFGEQNFVANFIRKNKAGSGHDSKHAANSVPQTHMQKDRRSGDLFLLQEFPSLVIRLSVLALWLLCWLVGQLLLRLPLPNERALEF